MMPAQRSAASEEAVQLAYADTSQLERLASYVPLVIGIYFALQLSVRLLISSNLEIDEAQFVGAIDWAWGYGDSQPPLYNWLVSMFVGALGYWPAIAILKYLALAATFYLVYDTARRAAGSRVIGAAAALSLAFVYQIIWQSQITLAHSVLLVAAAAATLHALVLVLQKGRFRDFVWLGVAVSAGLLSKYSFAVFLLSVGLGIGSVSEFRRAFFRTASLVTICLVVGAFLPHAIWAIEHHEVTTARLSRLDEGSVFSRLGLSVRGADGLFSLLWAIGSATVPMVLARLIAEACSRRSLSVSAPPAATVGGAKEFAPPASYEAMRKLCGRTTLFAIAFCVAIVVAADLHSVPERYLTLLLIPFPIWLSLAYPLAAHPRVAFIYVSLAAGVALVAALLLPIPVLFGTHPYAFPYREMAAELAQLAKPPFAVFASRREHSANIAIRISGAVIFTPSDVQEKVLLLWTEREGTKPEFLPRELSAAYSPAGEIILLKCPYAYYSGKEARLLAQVWERTP